MSTNSTSRSVLGPHQAKMNKLNSIIMTPSSRRTEIKENFTNNVPMGGYESAFNREFLGKPRIPEREEPTRNPLWGSFKVENEIIRDLQREKEMMKSYNNQLIKQLEIISSGKEKPIFNKEILFDSTHSELHNLLLSSDKISPLVKALDEQNKALKEEITSLSSDLTKCGATVTFLIKENEEVRSHLQNKNRDIAKLLETIGINDGELMREYKMKINILQEENNILITHLEELKRYKEGYEGRLDDKIREADSVLDGYDELKKNLELALLREKDIIQQKEAFSRKFYEAQEELERLETKESDMDRELSQSRNEIISLKSKCQKLKEDYDDVVRKKNLENDELIQEKNLVEIERKELKNKLILKEQKYETSDEEKKKLKQDNERYRKDMEELESMVSILRHQVAEEKKVSESLKKRERDLREKLEKAGSENERFNLKYSHLEKQYNNLLQSSRTELQEKNIKYDKIIDNMKTKHDDQIRDLEKKIEDLLTGLEKERTVIDRMQRDKREKDDELEATKKRMRELKRTNHSSVEPENQMHKQLTSDVKLKEENDYLRKRINDITSELDDARLENDELTKNIRKLEAELLESRGREKENIVSEEAFNNVRNLTSENESLRKRVLQLESVNSTLTQKINDLNERIGSLAAVQNIGLVSGGGGANVGRGINPPARNPLMGGNSYHQDSEMRSSAGRDFFSNNESNSFLGGKLTNKVYLE